METINAQSAGLIDNFAALFENKYRFEPELILIRTYKKLPKDDEYYPGGMELNAA